MPFLCGMPDLEIFMTPNASITFRHQESFLLQKFLWNWTQQDQIVPSADTWPPKNEASIYSIYLSSIHLFIYLYIYPSIHHLSIHLFIHLFILTFTKEMSIEFHSFPVNMTYNFNKCSLIF